MVASPKNQIPSHWQINNSRLQRTFEFEDFKQAFEFVKKVADLAEKDDHHPDININYNKITLSLYTHSQDKITDQDYLSANKIDLLIS